MLGRRLCCYMLWLRPARCQAFDHRICFDFRHFLLSDCDVVSMIQCLLFRLGSVQPLLHLRDLLRAHLFGGRVVLYKVAPRIGLLLSLLAPYMVRHTVIVQSRLQLFLFLFGQFAGRSRRCESLLLLVEGHLRVLRAVPPRLCSTRRTRRLHPRGDAFRRHRLHKFIAKGSVVLRVAVRVHVYSARDPVKAKVALVQLPILSP
mmetsp:Transcript_52556/g.87741  ORF Transcript_52556/g.87741 Transcript_52556/m.87741 type:complete len:203 (-) Transcript_52556:127-735(-)